MIGCGSPEPSITPGPQSSLPAVADTPFPTGALDPGLGWQRVDLTGIASPGVVTAVIVSNGRFLAVGAGGDDAPKSIGLVSPDGLTWLSEAMASEYGTPSGLLNIGEAVIAIGAGGTSRCAHPFALDSWARSVDGRWSEAAWNESFCAGLNQAHLVAWRGAVWLVASGSGDQPFDWSSADGLHWAARGTVGGILPTAAVVDGDALLAFGTDDTGAAAARRTADGVHWTAVTMPPPRSTTIPAAFVRDGALRVFLDDNGRIAVLTRDATGKPAIVPAKGMEGVADAGTFVDVGDRLVRLSEDADGLPVGWSSVDGVAWAPIQLPADSGPGTNLRGVAVLNGTAVLVGQTVSADGSSSIGAIWTGAESLLGG